jgi:cytochrome P450
MKQAEDLPLVQEMAKLRSYREVEEALRSRDLVSGRFEHESLPFREKTVIELEGEEHLARRRLVSALFGKAALASYETEILDPAIRRCLAEAASRRSADGLVRTNLVNLTRRMLLQIAAAFIGLDGVATPERTDRLLACAGVLQEAVDVKWATRDHKEVVTEGLEAKRIFIDEFLRASQQRRKQLLREYREGVADASALPSDLITVMLLHASPDWDDDLPVRESILYLVAALTATSSAVSHTVLELTAWFEKHAEGRSSLQDTDFLRKAGNEAIRLHASVPYLVRRAVRNTVLSNGRSIREGEEVALDLVSANLDPSVFPDPLKFDPYRQLAPGIRPYGLSFGAGPHVCIGRPMVLTVSGRAEEGGEIERILVRVLNSLYTHGVRMDDAATPTVPPTAEDRFDDFPVVFDAL